MISVVMLDHFLTHLLPPKNGRVSLGGAAAVRAMLRRQQLWDAVGVWRGQESPPSDSDASPAKFALYCQADGGAEMRLTRGDSELAVLRGRWAASGGGRRLQLTLHASGAVEASPSLSSSWMVGDGSAERRRRSDSNRNLHLFALSQTLWYDGILEKNTWETVSESPIIRLQQMPQDLDSNTNAVNLERH